MKKLLLVVAAVCLVGFATSCKKECTCTVGPVKMDLTSLGIDTKEKCTDYEKAAGETDGVMKCEWK
jgi:hypothetical protein